MVINKIENNKFIQKLSYFVKVSHDTEILNVTLSRNQKNRINFNKITTDSIYSTRLL